MSNRALPSAVVLALALGIGACSGAAATPSTSPASAGDASAAPATPAPTAPPAPTATPAPTMGAIAHPTGADQVVLRFEEAGGFVPPEWLAARLPAFTLYGDGRVVFVQATAEIPQRADNVSVGQPIRTAVLSEDQVQALLQFALSDGGLAIAKADYNNPMVADAPTAVFTVNAENDTKTVSVMALGMEAQPGPDTRVLAQLAKLGERLRDFDQGGSLASEPYMATAYRGVILEQQGLQGVAIRDWPWTDITPADFAMPADPNQLQQGTRTLTPDEATQVGVTGFENGVASGVFLAGPDGKTYSLVIRPLLPDETA